MHGTRRLVAFVIVLLGVGAGAGVGSYFRHLISNQRATLDVEAFISKGQRFNAYYNDNWANPEHAAVHANEWAHYSFTMPSRLTSLRLDPTEQDGATVMIRSIKLSGGDGRAVSVDLAQMPGWLRYHAKTVMQADHSLLMTTDGIECYTMSTVNLSVGSSNQFLRHFGIDGQTLIWCFAGAVGIALLLSVQRGNAFRSLSALVLISVAMVAAQKVALAIFKSHLTLIAPTHAVGAAAFSGFSLSNELRAVDVGILLVAMVAVIGSFAWSRKLPEVVSSRQRVSWLVFGLLLFASAVIAFPPAAAYLANALSGHQPFDFDTQNVYTWEFLARAGKIPFRDFWFPYGGFYNRQAPLFPDFFIDYLHQLLLNAVVLWCGLKVFRRQWGMVILFAAVFFYFEAAGLFWIGSASRYFLSMSIVMLAAVAIEEVSVATFVGLGVWCVYVISQEISQVVYAAPGAVLMLGVALVGSPERKSLLRCLAAGVGAGLAAFIVLLGKFFFFGQLSQWWIFVRTLSAQADYGAWPAQIAEWLKPSGSLDCALIVLLAALAFGGVWQVIGKTQLDVYRVLPLALALLGCMVLQKEIVRPGSETQFMVFPVFGLMLLTYQQVTDAPRSRQFAWLGFAAGALVACFIYRPPSSLSALIPWLDNVKSLPENVSATLAPREEWARAADKYFAADSYSVKDVSGRQLRDQIAAAASMKEGDDIFILANEPLLYVWLNKPVPFYTNLYNESPLESQTTTVQWLQKHNPTFVLWDGAANQFDGVPNAVRLPLVFDYVMENYKPSGAVANLQILRRLQPGEAPDVAYWAKELGSTVELGFIPAASVLERMESGPESAEALLVSIKNPRDGERVNVPLEIGGASYSVAFSAVGERHDFVIRLDRIPLLQLAHRGGGAVQVGGMVGGIQASVSTVRVPFRDLY